MADSSPDELKAIPRALRAIDCEHPPDELDEGGRSVGAERTGARRLAGEKAMHELVEVGVSYGSATGHAVEKDGSKGIHVGARIGGASRRWPAPVEGTRKVPMKAPRSRLTMRTQRSADAEVENLDAGRVAIDKKKVAWFQVAMDDVPLVQPRETARYRMSQGERVAHAQGSALEAAFEVFPIEPFHGEPTLAVRSDSVIDVSDHVCVLDRLQERNFAVEAAGMLVRAQHLQRDAALGKMVVSAVDDAHVAGADDRQSAEAWIELGKGAGRTRSCELSGIGHGVGICCKGRTGSAR